MLLSFSSSLLPPYLPRPLPLAHMPQTIEAEAPAAAAAAPAAAPNGKAAEIYIGHGKDDVEAKKAGVKGRFVVDDPSKYPRRDEYSGEASQPPARLP